MNTPELLDKAKTKLGIDTDYKLAKTLGIKDARIYDYRHGNRTPDNYAIARFAEILEIDPWSLVKEIEAQTEKNEKRREFWKRAAVFLLGGFLSVNLFVTPSPAEAAETQAQILDNNVYYVKL